MRVCRDRTAEREAVGACLLLRDRPRGLAQVVEQSGPLDSGLDGDPAGLAVVVEHAIEPAGVDQDPASAELLATHCVAAAGDADREFRVDRPAHDLLDVLDGGDLDDLSHLGAV